MTLAFVETPHFTRQIADHVNDEDYRALQKELLLDPQKGDLLVGCNGLRKVRMAISGRGKSGGARVIYLHIPDFQIIYFFLLFRKSDQVNLTKSQRNQLGTLAEQIKSEYERKKKHP